MRVIEKLGLTREKFKIIYDENGGFNNQFNKNHPTYGIGEKFLSFLNAGSKHLAESETELIKDIINRG